MHNDNGGSISDFVNESSSRQIHQKLYAEIDGNQQ